MCFARAITTTKQKPTTRILGVTMGTLGGNIDIALLLLSQIAPIRNVGERLAHILLIFAEQRVIDLKRRKYFVGKRAQITHFAQIFGPPTLYFIGLTNTQKCLPKIGVLYRHLLRNKANSTAYCADGNTIRHNYLNSLLRIHILFGRLILSRLKNFLSH